MSLRPTLTHTREPPYQTSMSPAGPQSRFSVAIADFQSPGPSENMCGVLKTLCQCSAIRYALKNINPLMNIAEMKIASQLKAMATEVLGVH